MENIVENNKLIAEFMGAKPNKGGEYELYGIIEGIEDGEHEQHFFFGSEMKFSTDWNWLIPVVEKIDYMLPDDNVITISYKTCMIPVVAGNFNCDDNDGFDIVSDGGTKIEAVYTAIIEFIKWYNLSVPELKWTKPPEKDILNEVKMLVDTGENIEYTRGVLEIVTSFMKGPNDLYHVDKVIALAHKIGIDEENIKKMY